MYSIESGVQTEMFVNKPKIGQVKLKLTKVSTRWSSPSLIPTSNLLLDWSFSSASFFLSWNKRKQWEKNGFVNNSLNEKKTQMFRQDHQSLVTKILFVKNMMIVHFSAISKHFLINLAKMKPNLVVINIYSL